MGRAKKKKRNRQEDVVSARVNPEFYKKVAVIAKSQDLTVTQVLRHALRDFVKRHNASPESKSEAA